MQPPASLKGLDIPSRRTQAVEQPKCAPLILAKPPPQAPQRISPEKRHRGRRFGQNASGASVDLVACFLAVALVETRLPRLDRIELARRDCEVGRFDHKDSVAGFCTRSPLVGFRILDIAEPIPDETSDVHLVVQDPCAARTIAVESGSRSRRRRVEPECGER